MRIETRPVPKLEFIPVPDAATAPCLVPLPPVDENGVLPYKLLPEYTAQVLSALEQCNIQLEQIRNLQPADVVSGDLFNHGSLETAWTELLGTPVLPTKNFEGQAIVLYVNVFNTHAEMQAEFKRITNNAFPDTTPWLRAVTLSREIEDTRYCRMLVVRPKVYEDAEWGSWGHELGHCVYEAWHKDIDWK